MTTIFGEHNIDGGKGGAYTFVFLVFQQKFCILEISGYKFPYGGLALEIILDCIIVTSRYPQRALHMIIGIKKIFSSQAAF